MKLYSVTLPGLDVRSDWRTVHDRLLDDFPAIEDVLPTTMVATLVIAYRGRAQVDGWLESIDEVLANSLDVRGRGLFECAHADVGEDRVRAPPVGRARLAPHVTVADEAVDAPGRAAR